MNQFPQKKSESKSGKCFHSARFYAFLFGFFCLFLVFFLVFILSLPSMVERQVGKILDRLSANGAFILQVKSIGMYRTEFSLRTSELSEAGQQISNALRIRSCNLRYRPFGLLKGQLELVELDGVNLTLDLNRGKPLFPVLNLFSAKKSVEDFSEQSSAPDNWYENLPIHVQRLSINGDILLLTEHEIIPIAFSTLLTPGATLKIPVWDYALALSNSRNQFRMTGLCDLSKARVSGQVKFSGYADSLPYSLRHHLPEKFSFSISSSGSFAYDLARLKFTALSVTNDGILNFQLGGLRLSGKPQLKLRTENEQILAELSGLYGEASGIEFALEQVTACLPQEKNASISGRCLASIAQQRFLQTDFQLTREFGKINFIASQPAASEQSEFRLNLPGLVICSQVPEFQASVTLSPELDYQFSATVKQVKVSRSGLEGNLEAVRLEGQGKGSAGNLQVLLPNSSLSLAAGVECSFPQISCAAAFQNGQIQAKCRFADAVVSIPASGLTANLSAELPLQWPFSTPSQQTGFFKIDPLLGNGEELGRLEGEFSFIDRGIMFQADGKLRGLCVALSVKCHPFALGKEPVLDGEFVLPEQDLSSEVLPKQFVPQLKGFECAGKLKAEGKFVYQANAFQGNALVKIHEGELRNPEKNFSLEGLRLNFSLPKLPELASAGNQLLAFQNLQFGKFVIRSGHVRFRMESPTSWHLENVTMNWCDGQLKLDSARINPENKRTRLVFHCDRLRLSALLQQLGAGLDQGEGRISGSIPLVISENGLRFRDAFLYSTPGETGSIKLLPSKSISATAAASDQLAFALDALADFNYSWVKLSLDSEKELLKIKLQTDGKPVNKLYYVPKDGTLVRSQVANEFTGLQLDANLNLPLNNTLQLYQNFKQLFDPR